METPLTHIMRWIYFSPHFDDAVLSCGGLIWDQSQGGENVEIWTVFAGDAPPGQLSPKAVALHQEWGLESAEDVVAARRIENQEAARLLGADTVDFGIPDCIYRRSPSGVPLYPEDVVGPLDPLEIDLDADIAAVLVSELQPDDRIVSPLAVGSHLDHVLTRHAVELLQRPLWYYADIPYIFNHPDTVKQAVEGLNGLPFSVSEKGLQAWLGAIGAYKSQLTSVYESGEMLQEAVRLYWKTRQGIQLWNKA